MDWKPIETAPKDGTRIIVHDYARPTFACWTSANLVRSGKPVKDWMNDHGGALQGVTHWMSPPDPPLS